MYKLKGEPKLLFDFLWAMDGNDSLKRVIRRSKSDDDLGAPGLSCELQDTRIVPGDMYISREDVNKWAREFVGQVQPDSGAVSVCLRVHIN